MVQQLGYLLKHVGKVATLSMEGLEILLSVAVAPRSVANRVSDEPPQIISEFAEPTQ